MLSLYNLETELIFTLYLHNILLKIFSMQAYIPQEEGEAYKSKLGKKNIEQLIVFLRI